MGYEFTDHVILPNLPTRMDLATSTKRKVLKHHLDSDSENRLFLKKIDF